MKSIVLFGLLALTISACGKVNAAGPSGGGCAVCDLDLSSVTERSGMLCNADELLRGTKMNDKGHIAVCVKPVCKCCH